MPDINEDILLGRYSVEPSSVRDNSEERRDVAQTLMNRYHETVVRYSEGDHSISADDVISMAQQVVDASMEHEEAVSDGRAPRGVTDLLYEGETHLNLEHLERLEAYARDNSSTVRPERIILQSNPSTPNPFYEDWLRRHREMEDKKPEPSPKKEGAKGWNI